jgi:hypothetical protein
LLQREQDHRVGCSSDRPAAERCNRDRRRTWQRREACRECGAGRESGTRCCPTFDAGDRAGAAEGVGNRAAKLHRQEPLLTSAVPARTAPGTAGKDIRDLAILQSIELHIVKHSYAPGGYLELYAGRVEGALIGNLTDRAQILPLPTARMFGHGEVGPGLHAL